MGAIVNRDLQAAAEVEHLYRLNYFSEEFILYATAYVEGGSIKYRFNEQSKPIYRFCHDALCRGVFSLPVEQYVKMTKVETGTREIKRMIFCHEIAQQMQETYPKELFQLQKVYQDCYPNDAAFEIFSQWKKDLMPCFSLEPLQLLEGAVKQAVAAKHLSRNSYKSLIQWIADRKRQIDDTVYEESGKQKILSGFLYKTEERWLAFSNAVEEVVWQKQNQYRQEGIVCTPILRKNYCTEIHPAWRNVQWKAEFDILLNRMMDEQYLRRIEQLQELSPVIDEAYCQRLYHTFLQDGNNKAAEVLRYYAAICNCKL